MDGRMFVDESDRRTDDILSAMDNFGISGKTEQPGSNSAHAVKTHPLLTSPSPTEPLGLPFIANASTGSQSQPQTAKVTPNDPMNHPLHHPPPNAWNSPKHQSKLSNLLGSSTASSSSTAQSSASGSKVNPLTSKVHPAPHERRISSTANIRSTLNTPSSSTHEALSEADHFNAKLGSSFCDEFNRLFASPRPWSALRDHAVNSHLRNCRFRSLCWKVFLRCLSEDVKKWEEETKACRLRYKDLKRKYSLNPRSADEAEQLDLNLNNPLSQAEDSPWSQYFKDNELKQVIWQDVVRTFPEIEFFQTELVQKIMQDILFVYAREHASIEYRQGMHELLAPLIFVIHCDQQTCAHACELEDRVPPLVTTLLEEKSLEPDAYDMFCRMMDIMEPLYQYGELIPVGKDCSGSTSMTGSTESQQQRAMPAEPFQNKDQSDTKLNCTSAINTKLRYIFENILVKHDHELYTHLELLDIAPQIYGLRWVRLLFGREFPLQDLLILWDAIFADEAGFQLVDFLFVAMLEFLRDFLLASEYTTCMKVLMKFPAVGDAAWFIKKAYNLRDPYSHPRPSNFSYSNILAKRAKMAKQLSGGGGAGTEVGSSAAGSVGGNAKNGNVSAKLPTNTLLTMVAGKQSGKSDFHSSTLPRSHSKSSPSEENAKSNGAVSGQPSAPSSSSVSSALSRFMSPAGSEVIMGTKGNDSTNALFSGAPIQKDAVRRQRAISDNAADPSYSSSSRPIKQSAGIAQRIISRVSTAEEALPSGGDEETPSMGFDTAASPHSADEIAELNALKRELKASRNRANDLETRLGDVGALVQSSWMKMNFLFEKLQAVESRNPGIVVEGELTKEALQVRRLLRESMKLCVDEDLEEWKAGDDSGETLRNGVGVEGGVAAGEKSEELIAIVEEIEETFANCLDDAAREALQSALMEEAVEATEPTQPLATPESTGSTTASKSNSLKAEGIEGDFHRPSVSPSSDCSDYSMVDANEEYIVDLVEACEKKL